MPLRLLRRLTYLWHQRQMAADLSEELEFHRAMKQRELETAGMPSDEAATASHLAVGNAALAREAAREVWIWPWLESVWQDVTYALRQLQRQPIFSLTIVAMLALGIGANTSVFAMMNALLFQPLPAVDAERIIVVRRGPNPLFSYADYRD